jgi:hypothetical protein
MRIKILVITIFMFVAFAGCAKKALTEREFSVIWQEYLQKEFEESFDEKQSMAQKEKILGQVLSRYRIKLEEFKSYMEKNHNDKFKKLFIE